MGDGSAGAEDVDEARERHEDEREGADAGPFEVNPGERGQRRADGCASEVDGHVDGVEAAAGGGVDAEDAGLVGDLRGLRAEVEHDDAGDEAGHVVSEDPEEEVGSGEGDQAEGNDEAGAATVRVAACYGRDECSGGAEDAKAAGHSRAHVVVRAAEKKDERGPEGAEGGEGQAADEGGFAEGGLGAEERPEGAQGVTVAEGRGGREKGHHLPDQRDEGEVYDAGDDEDDAPVADFADPPGKGAGEQDAEQKAGHDGADGASALAVAGQSRGDGQHDVGDGGEESDERAGDEQGDEVWREGDGEEREGDGGEHAHHQGAALDDIAERDDEEEPNGVADQGGDGDKAGVAGDDVEALGHLQQKRLVVVDAGDADSAGESQKGNHPAGVFLVRSHAERGLTTSVVVSAGEGQWLGYI